MTTVLAKAASVNAVVIKACEKESSQDGEKGRKERQNLVYTITFMMSGQL